MGFVSEKGYTREEALRSVGDGWANGINILFDAKPDDVRVAQVKEKFGGLRFYTDGASREYQQLIRYVESLCDMLCENCGKIGIARRGGWIKTLCTDCNAKVEAAREKGVKDLQNDPKFKRVAKG